MKKRIIIVLVLVAVGVAGVYTYRGAKSTPSNRIVVSGNIELTEVNIAFKTAGRLIERTGHGPALPDGPDGDGKPGEKGEEDGPANEAEPRSRHQAEGALDASGFAKYTIDLSK